MGKGKSEMDYNNYIITFKNFKRLLILFLVFKVSTIAFSQPANNNCIAAEDLSDRLWHPGTSVGGTISCINDLRLGNCGAAQQGTDKCCAIAGIESSLWYTFTIPNTETVYVDFRNITCTNSSRLQGFAFRTPDCVTPELDVVDACFNAATTADVNGQMSFTAIAGQLYYLEIDTERNIAFPTCGTCAAPNAGCHANCNWEIRVRTNTPTLLKDFNLSILNEAVVASWFYDFQENYSDFRITRKKLADNSLEVVSEGPVNKYHLRGHDFQYEDHSVMENGLYTYYLEGSHGGVNFQPIINKTVFVGYIDEIDVFLIPNPAKDDLKISVTNIKDGKASYEIYSPLGILIISGNIDKHMQHSIINTCLIPRGMYFVKVVIGNTVLSRKLLLD
jgi:hypothetical protein